MALLAVQGNAVAAPSGSNDVVGQPYGDASSALSSAGLNPVIGVVVGSQLPIDKCIVTNAQTVSALRPALIGESYQQFDSASCEVMVTLICNGGYATATRPGASVASPEGRQARVAADQAANAERGALAEVSTPDQ